MAENELLKRYLDAGMAFTQMTQQRAEAIVKNLVAAGELQREQTQSAVEELVERSRKNTERLLDTVRVEIRAQITNRGLATKADIARLEKRIDAVARAAKPASAAPKKRAAKKTAKPAAKKA